MSDSNRIDQCFAKLKSESKAAFVAYVCAGDPNMDECLKIMKGLESAGVDIIELGVPFSDPMADGVVNQMAAHRALEAGATFPGVLELIKKFRETSEVPIVLFTYLNPVYTYGFERFHIDSAAAGVDGVLLLDLPPEEAAKNADMRETAELKHIRLIAPTTPGERIPQLAASAEGFIYYVSREGVTGAQTSLAEGIAENVANIQKHTDVPIVVGFGISTPEQSATVAEAAEGVVVGSAIVRIVEQNASDPDVAAKVEAFVKPLVDGAKSV
ncbi:MAG: tryptophan synthase subunit alpha [Verrucomicrobiales bacterium]|nr:tryptophan synthase subunit alpha [Verrucomicrobiales bacterium]